VLSDRSPTTDVNSVSAGNRPGIQKVSSTLIRDCYLIELSSFQDQRGAFVKNYQEPEFRKLGLETDFPEEFYTRSVEGVLRGIHFTVPPIDQVKQVTCVHGTVIDAVIDLRIGSPTFGKHQLFELSGERPSSLYIGKGIGHAFYVPHGEAVLLYRVSTLYCPEFDKGIRWDSAGIPWPLSNPLVSDRDKGLPDLSSFESPFRYGDTDA
jgi:dTDP-4-dehydrorhamnose 3,5-epimerase